MAYSRIVGAGAQAPGPNEKIALTAAAAKVERSSLQRLCGKYGRVEVSGKDRRTISPERLQRPAQDETLPRCGDGGVLPIPNSQIPGPETPGQHAAPFVIASPGPCCGTVPECPQHNNRCIAQPYRVKYATACNNPSAQAAERCFALPLPSRGVRML